MSTALNREWVQGCKGLKLTFGVSHISRKTSEMWGTRDLWQIRKVIKRLRSTGVRFQGREGKSPAG